MKESEVQFPEYLYHYTKIGTLQHMFKKNGKVDLRLTDYRFLNDAEEGRFLGKFIEKNRESYCDKLIGKNLKELFNEYADFVSGRTDRLQEAACRIYMMSFTEVEDSMQFWRQDYAKEKGICLKLKPSCFNVPNRYADFSYDPRAIHPLRKVQYIGINDNIEGAFPDLKRTLRSALGEIRKAKASIKDEGVLFMPKILNNFEIKNRVWKSEEEWRFIVLRYSDHATSGGLSVRYEIDEVGIPRAKIEIDNPFEEIILGPSFSAAYVASIKEWLSDRGFGNVNVRCGDGVLNN